MEEANKLMLDIYERLGGIDAKLNGVNEVKVIAVKADDKAEDALKLASEVNESTKSAHKRLDKIDKIIWWVATSIIGAVIVSLLALVIKQ